MTRKLELLAPAKNLECGIAAIDCGADAVYIGAPKFGARAAVGNSLDDIKGLTDYAHQFGAKVYVTLNTIVYDHELAEVRRLVADIAEIGIDAVLVQDMAVLEMVKEAGLVVHASTQTDNRDKDKVAWMKSLGCERVVLARELSWREISDIHKAHPDVELEAFVHGALCVSYSGACYASQYCFSRSANRGECAQFCRMKFDLIDADGREWEHQRHLLSLKDMCQIDHLEELADAGVISFKIEGRLKDISYVKNVVAAYSQRLDRICEKRSGDYTRASLGKVTYAFTPDLKKTFNRGYTNYFLNGRVADIFSPDTPKAIGEYVGKVKEIRGKSLNVAGLSNFSNGDGLCFINSKKELEGFRVNRVEGNRLYLLNMPTELRPKMALYRNNDVAFDKELARQGTERRIPLMLTLSATHDGISLKAEAEYLPVVMVEEMMEKQPAQKPQRDNIINQLSKWGNTIYMAERVIINDNLDKCFIPSSKLSSLRKRLHDALSDRDNDNTSHKITNDKAEIPSAMNGKHALYFKNVSNEVSQEWHEERGINDYSESLETNKADFSLPLMQCRHCLRYSLGYCVKRGGQKPQWKEPLELRLGDGRRFRLQFDCKECQMNVYAEKC